jgi:hypothetical protein
LIYYKQAEKIISQSGRSRHLLTEAATTSYYLLSLTIFSSISARCSKIEKWPVSANKGISAGYCRSNGYCRYDGAMFYASKRLAASVPAQISS